MKGKKLGTSVLAAVMLAGTTAMPVLAAMPTQSVVIGENAFSLEYANDVENIAQIKEALKGNTDKIFVKFNNKWFNNDGSNLADVAVIPAVAYVTADGEVNYEAGDGEEATDGFNIVDISPVGVKEIKVAFSEAVDTDKASFEVKKGSIVRNQDSVEWNDEKTEATINLLGIISEGDYTVTVKGTDLEGDDAKRTFAAEDEVVTSIEIVGDKAPVKVGINDDADEQDYVTIEYKVYNQYGNTTDGNEDLTVTLSDKDEENNEYWIADNAVALQLPFTVTVIDKTTGVFASKVMTPVAEAKVSEVVLGDILKVDDDELVSTTIDTGLTPASEDVDPTLRYIAINAKDQYGNDVTDVAKLKEEITFVIAESILKVSEVKVDDKDEYVIVTEDELLDNDEDDKLYIQIEAGKSITAMNLELRAVSNNNGNTAIKTIEIAEASEIDTFELEMPEELIVSGEEIEFNFNAYDQNGVELSEDDKSELEDVDNFSISASQGEFVFGYDFENDKATLTLDLTDSDELLNSDVPATITVITPSGQVISKQITVKAQAVAEEISIKDATKLMTVDATTELDEDNLVVTDQYGREMDLEDFFAKGYDLTVAPVDDSDANVDLVEDGTTTSSITLLAYDKDATIDFKGIEDGKREFELKIVDPSEKGDDQDIFTYNFALETIDVEDVSSYKVEMPEVLYNGIDTNYAEAFSVYGLTSSGKKIALADADYSVNLPSTEVESVDVDYLVIDATEGTIMGNDVELDSEDDNDDEKDVNILVFTVGDGSQIVKTIKLKEEAPEIVKTEIEDGEALITVSIADITDEDEPVSIIDQIKAQIIQVDQYGFETDLTDGRAEYDYLLADDSSNDDVTFGIADEDFTIDGDLEAGDSFKVKVLIGTDKVTVTVKVVE